MAASSVIDNPLSGEHIVIHAGATDELLVWELFLAPGGAVPSRHQHPRQEERFCVIAGQMRFRVGRRSMTVGAGEAVVVPPSTVHHFANAGARTAHVVVETRPALDMEAMLRTAAALARDQQAAGRAFPRPVDLALFLRDFEQEVTAPYLPPRLVQLALRPVVWLARTRHLDVGYRAVRIP